ncbi:Zinc finger RING-type [Arabidopsis thaliana x Arabidopsis arenosa]|uniref:Zinc finger RING-type n=2 Tax=Arabidopsis thaliana x Arabidopsis arenosa TaxID=1240361 RepID=A0A8T1Y8B6_9BRAS|nr:Zinc finger RING-type [Arabidopsis thaliana x Arabidopsis arenosa]
MAVQAQHPSSFFFINSNGQEANDCSLQHQDTHFTNFINAGVDSRKRSRKVYSSVTTMAPMNPPPPKPSQVIDLTELMQKTPNVVSTGLRLSHDQSQNQQHFYSSLSGDVTGKIKRQRDELDRFIQTQGEELRRTLAENRERRYVELLCAAEEVVGRKVRERDAELEKATRLHAELEARVAHLAEEARNWQLRAATREAEVSSLQAHLQQAIASRRDTAANQSTFRDDDGDAEEAEDAESVYEDPERIELFGPSCRICRQNLATVMALPCRHLALCEGCDGGTLRACPICLAVTNTGVEILYS